jgi:hypothetical protein
MFLAFVWWWVANVMSRMPHVVRLEENMWEIYVCLQFPQRLD